MPAGRPRKPNSLHVAEGTARGDRGTDVTYQVPTELSREPKDLDWSKFKRDKTFKVMKDWVIAATGAAEVDGILLTMMNDVLEEYASAKLSGDTRAMGPLIDRYHKLAREFGMTPATRDAMVKKAVEEDQMKDILEGP